MHPQDHCQQGYWATQNIIEVQGKWFCRTREHIRPIHLNIPALKAPKQQPPKPIVNTQMPSHIPQPNPNLKLVSYPKKYLSNFLCTPLHLQALTSSKSSQVPSVNASPSFKQLLQHLSTHNSVCPVQLGLPWDTQPAPPMHCTPEKISAESPCSVSTESSQMSKDSSSRSSNSFSHSTCSTASTHILRPRLHITYNKAALSCLYRRPPVKTLNNISIPHPISSDEESPTAEAESLSPNSPELSPANSPDGQISHRLREESPTLQMPDSPATVEESPTLQMPNFPEEDSPTMMKVPLPSSPQEPRQGNKEDRNTDEI